MPKTFREVVAEAKQQIEEIAPEEVERLKSEGETPLILDVREKEDYEDGHLPGAVSLPRGLLELNIDDHTTDEDRPIVLYCGGGSRSALATKSLRDMGYRNVKSMAGGFRGWKDSGRKVERDSS